MTRRGITITGLVESTVRIGDTMTFVGVEQPDRRWWPRLKAWLLRRPPPTIAGQLQRFVITDMVP